MATAPSNAADTYYYFGQPYIADFNNDGKPDLLTVSLPLLFQSIPLWA
jgi:hypothetical protein